MIHIYGSYYAEPYQYGYTLKKDGGKNEKGETKWATLGYFGEMEGVVRCVYNDYVKNKLSSQAVELKEALKVFKEAKEMFRELLGGLEDVKKEN